MAKKNLTPKFGVKVPRGSEVWYLLRSENIQQVLKINWGQFGQKLVEAKSLADVQAAVAQHDEMPGAYRLKGAEDLLWHIRQDPAFPTEREEAKAIFIADSFAGGGHVSIRRSRDICGRLRTARKRTTYILRYEYWIECSCGYKGRSQDHGCPKCKAAIVLEVNRWAGFE